MSNNGEYHGGTTCRVRAAAPTLHLTFTSLTLSVNHAVNKSQEHDLSELEPMFTMHYHWVKHPMKGRMCRSVSRKVTQPLILSDAKRSECRLRLFWVPGQLLRREVLLLCPHVPLLLPASEQYYPAMPTQQLTHPSVVVLHRQRPQHVLAQVILRHLHWSPFRSPQPPPECIPSGQQACRPKPRLLAVLKMWSLSTSSQSSIWRLALHNF